jgi:hypothetical protein
LFLGTVKETYRTIPHRFDRATSIVPPLILMVPGDRRCIGESVKLSTSVGRSRGGAFEITVGTKLFSLVRFTATIEISVIIDFFPIYNHPLYNLNILTLTCLTLIETLRNAF